MKLAVGVVVALIVAVVGVLLLTPEKGEDSAKLSVNTNERMKGTGVLSELFSNGDSLVCNYTTSDDSGMTNEGTMYFDAATERFQVRNKMTDQTGTYNSGVLNDGVTMYTWAESSAGVIAFAVPAEQETDVDTEADFQADPDFPTDATEPDALSAEVVYDCVSWNVDESVFTPPENVTFVSPEDMLKSALESMNQTTEEIPVE